MVKSIMSRIDEFTLDQFSQQTVLVITSIVEAIKKLYGKAPRELNHSTRTKENISRIIRNIRTWIPIEEDLDYKPRESY